MENKIIEPLSDEYIDMLNQEFKKSQKLMIKNFLQYEFAHNIYNYALLEKNWTLSTGINNIKYEKPLTFQFEKANQLQLKNVNIAFGNDHFSYIFNRSMNSNIKNTSFFEFTLRKTLSSEDFIKFLNKITNLQLTKLTTLFMSRYKSGNFLSPHSDKGNGKLAFVINISKNWKPQYGGNLHFMNDERTEITETYVPEFNSFVIFHVPLDVGIPHFVSHVAPNVKFSRYAITGWFD